MKNKKISICDATIHPGEQANLALALPELYSCAPMYMPIRIIHGKQEGPCLLLFALVRGNELNGFEIINRIMNDDKIKDQLNGTIIAVPILNVYGLTQQNGEVPSENAIYDSFPGKEDGSYGERIAHIFTQEILLKTNYCIELKTGELNHNILPQVYCDTENTETRNLAKHFQVPVIMKLDTDLNTMRRTIAELNIPLLVYEAGEALRFDENAIQQGMKGTLNAMRLLEMLPEEEEQKTVKTIFSQDEEWIRAPKGGILHPKTILGQVVEKDAEIGFISDPFGKSENESIKAPIEGIVVGINNHPLISEGQPVFKIATFIDNERAGATIGEWEEQQQNATIDAEE